MIGLAPLFLFLCRSNTATSIMAEAILRHFAHDRLQLLSLRFEQLDDRALLQALERIGERS